MRIDQSVTQESYFTILEGFKRLALNDIALTVKFCFNILHLLLAELLLVQLLIVMAESLSRKLLLMMVVDHGHDGDVERIFKRPLNGEGGESHHYERVTAPPFVYKCYLLCLRHDSISLKLCII